MQRRKVVLTFFHSFAMADSEQIYLAGTYVIESDGELPRGITLPATRRRGQTIQRLNDNVPKHRNPTSTRGLRAPNVVALKT